MKTKTYLSKRLWGKRRGFGSQRTICITDKFLFIQVPKTGSTTLLLICQGQKLLRKILPEPDCYRHEGLDYLSNFVDSDLDFLAICRNPFSHALSYFFHRVAYKEEHLERGQPIKYYKNSFKKWLLKPRWHNNVHLQQIRYMKINGKYAIDHLFRFENGVSQTINYINQKYNLQLVDKHLNKNRLGDIYEQAKRELISFYDNETIECIVEARAEEFSTFGYSTDISKWREE